MPLRDLYRTIWDAVVYSRAYDRVSCQARRLLSILQSLTSFMAKPSIGMI